MKKNLLLFLIGGVVLLLFVISCGVFTYLMISIFVNKEEEDEGFHDYKVLHISHDLKTMTHGFASMPFDVESEFYDDEENEQLSLISKDGTEEIYCEGACTSSSNDDEVLGYSQLLLAFPLDGAVTLFESEVEEFFKSTCDYHYGDEANTHVDFCAEMVIAADLVQSRGFRGGRGRSRSAPRRLPAPKNKDRSKGGDRKGNDKTKNENKNNQGGKKESLKDRYKRMSKDRKDSKFQGSQYRGGFFGGGMFGSILPWFFIGSMFRRDRTSTDIVYECHGRCSINVDAEHKDYSYDAEEFGCDNLEFTNLDVGVAKGDMEDVMLENARQEFIKYHLSPTCQKQSKKKVETAYFKKILCNANPDSVVCVRNQPGGGAMSPEQEKVLIDELENPLAPPQDEV